MKKLPMPKLEKRCSPADEWDSRGPGWYCCECNRMNPTDRSECRACGHKECRRLP